jgi:hypothetical protein
VDSARHRGRLKSASMPYRHYRLHRLTQHSHLHGVSGVLWFSLDNSITHVHVHIRFHFQGGQFRGYQRSNIKPFIPPLWPQCRNHGPIYSRAKLFHSYSLSLARDMYCVGPRRRRNINCRQTLPLHGGDRIPRTMDQGAFKLRLDVTLIAQRSSCRLRVFLIG